MHMTEYLVDAFDMAYQMGAFKLKARLCEVARQSNDCYGPA